MLDIVFYNSTADKTQTEKFFRKILETAITAVRLPPKNIELSLSLVAKDKIKALNQKFRDKNKATDVLSFPLLSKIDKNSEISGIIALGDIFICLPVAKEDAKKEGLDLNFKLAFLTIHGFLHLLGYDHEKPKDRTKMFALQNKLLKNLSF
jgi:probable rRNA maturation factor